MLASTFHAALLALALVLGGCVGLPGGENYTQPVPGTALEFDMVWVAEGGFWIGRHEVTWDEYLVFCAWDGGRTAAGGADAAARPSKPVVPYDRDWGLGRRPAVGMSWNAARHFCRWLSEGSGHDFRLPTEREWSMACGSGGEPLSTHAWYAANSGGKTHEVGLKEPNDRGIHDMLGNLWEYCRNPFDPSEPDRAVLRGGSWKDPAEQVTPQSRLAFDDDWVLMDPNVPPGVWWVPDGEHLGFRVVRHVRNEGAGP